MPGLRTCQRLRSTLVVAAILLTPGIVWAQNATPPAPTLTRSQPAWLGFFIMFILVAAVLAVSLMPSKRSHQD